MKNLIICDSLEESLQEIKKDCIQLSQIENCGFLGFDKSSKAFVVACCENKSDEPNNSFLVSPYDYLDFQSKYKIVCVYHSHTGVSTPSSADKIGCKNTCLPYLIYGINDNEFSLIIPKILDKYTTYQMGIKKLKSFIGKL